MKILLLDFSAKSKDKMSHGGEINTFKYSTDEETAWGKDVSTLEARGFQRQGQLVFPPPQQHKGENGATKY